MTLYAWAASLWRTAASFIVSFAAVQLARIGVDLDGEAVVSFMTVVFGAGYYALFRYLEQHFDQRWGWFLGLARMPQYDRAETGE